MSVAITLVKFSKNPVNVKEQIKIQVSALTVTTEPIMYRLPHKLGNPKGNNLDLRMKTTINND